MLNHISGALKLRRVILVGTWYKGIRVEVKNEHRQHVLTVTVSLQIDQVGLMPHSSV
jgi:hypothetical protein